MKCRRCEDKDATMPLQLCEECYIDVAEKLADAVEKENRWQGRIVE